MQMLTAEAAAREGDWDAVQPALRAVCARWPDSLTAWNAHSRRGNPAARPGSCISTGSRNSCRNHVVPSTLHLMRRCSCSLAERHEQFVDQHLLLIWTCQRSVTRMSGDTVAVCRMLATMRRPQQASKHVRTLRQKHPTSLPLTLLHGHLLAAQVLLQPPVVRRHGMPSPIDNVGDGVEHGQFARRQASSP